MSQAQLAKSIVIFLKEENTKISKLLKEMIKNKPNQEDIKTKTRKSKTPKHIQAILS